MTLQVVIEVQDTDNIEDIEKRRNIKAYMFNIKSGKDYKLVYPLQLEPSHKIGYFEVHPLADPTDRRGIQPSELSEKPYGDDGGNVCADDVYDEEDAQARHGGDAEHAERTNAAMHATMISSN